MNVETKKRYKDIDLPFTCPITNRVFNSTGGLSIYVTKSLKMDHSIYYDTYINHRDNSCFFCGNKGAFISVGKGYRNLCLDDECVKKSFRSHSIEGFMYRNVCSREDAEIQFNIENNRQLIERTKTQEALRKENKNWDKERSRNCKEFWIKKGFSEEDSILKSVEVMKEIHKKTSKKLKDNPENYLTKYPTKIEYYTNKGISEEDAIKEISKIQNRFSLERCIRENGDKVGHEIWLNRQIKWQNSLKDNGNLKGGYSEISQVLFRDILNLYPIKEISNIYFYTKNNEYLIRSDKSLFLYDFTDISKKKIIEYNGDQYHANPNIYKEYDLPHPYHKKIGFYAKDIWEKDKRKEDIAKKRGFDILVIWDSEYRKHPKETLEKCIKFINE